MIYRLDQETWQEKIDLVAHSATSGDLVLVPSIKALNQMTEMLTKFRPGVLVYVRVDGFRYFPRVGEEQEVEL